MRARSASIRNSFTILNKSLASDQGKHSEAVTPFERALALDPNGLQPLTNVGSIYMKAGRLDHGAQTLERAVTLHAGVISDMVRVLQRG
jgi:Flp pilus assembly protein TadD